jgi:formylglycine-generating enzyme required for sulfatase activity
MLSAFSILRTEVTQRHYAACVAAGMCTAPSCAFTPQATPTSPAVCVRWSQAAAFCTWAGMRLPSEAEWEYAARRDERIYPWGDQPPDCTDAVFAGCGVSEAQPVGGRPRDVSPHGVADMAGNVSEWVGDWYSATYYSVSPLQDPRGPASGGQKVIRGGDFTQSANVLRGSHRGNDAPELNAAPSMGFRCAH